MLFEVSAPNGARTHAGVLEFSPEVPEGVALLPDKVQDCLWGLGPAAAAPCQGNGGADAAGPGPGSSSGGGAAGEGARCGGRVHIAYKRLEKGTYVRLQPELRAFHEEVGADPEAMRAALEDALHGVCCLTEGDWVKVCVGGPGAGGACGIVGRGGGGVRHLGSGGGGQEGGLALVSQGP
jgi:ubiquitin fusion degradation protein 1